MMRLYTLIYGLGYEIPDGYWDELVSNTRVLTRGPQVAIWESINRAVENGSVGEAILLFLIAMAESGPGIVHPFEQPTCLMMFATIDKLLSAIQL